MKVQKKYYPQTRVRDHEVTTKVSMTIPDQALSIKEILQRFTRGLPISGMGNPMFQGEKDILGGRDLRALDLSEKHDLLTAMEGVIKTREQEVMNKRQMAERNRIKEELRKELEAEAEKNKYPIKTPPEANEK